jgi:hypothetical protein
MQQSAHDSDPEMARRPARCGNGEAQKPEPATRMPGKPGDRRGAEARNPARHSRQGDTDSSARRRDRQRGQLSDAETETDEGGQLSDAQTGRARKPETGEG